MAPPFISFSSQIAIITISIFFLSSSLPPASSATSLAHLRPFKKIYAFGDSYTDTGNTVSATGPSGFNYVSSLPYGSTFFHHSTNRYSDGRLVIDFVAEALSLPYLAPHLSKKADKSTGINFAVAGSTAIRHSFFVKNNLTLNITPQSLVTQLKWFNKSLEAQGCKGSTTTSQCNEAIYDALFWVGEIGVNDYAYTLGSSVSSTTILQLAIKSVTGFLEVINYAFHT